MNRLVLIASLFLALLAGASEAAPGNRLRLIYIPQTNPTFPTSQTVNFGAKNLVGFGGDPMGYASPQLLGKSRWLAITSQLDKDGAAVSIFVLDDRQMLVPTNAGAAISTTNYGAAWTSAHANGPYTLVVAEYRDAAATIPTGAQTTITVPTPAAGTAYAREMTASYNNCTVNCEVLNPDGCSNPLASCTSFSAFKWQLGTMLGSGSAICGGDTIYLRDAGTTLSPTPFNPAGAGTNSTGTTTPTAYRIRPGANPYSCGAGNVTVTSQTWDNANDANGNPRLQNGFQFGGGVILDASTAGNVALNLAFDHLWCGAFVGTPSACISFASANGTTVSLTYSRCGGVLNETAFTAGTACLSGDGHASLTYSHNHAYRAGKNFTSGGNAVAEWNICEQNRNDCIDYKKGNNTIRYNWGFDWHGVQPNHGDLIQRIVVGDSQTYGNNVVAYNLNSLGDTSYMIALGALADPPQCMFAGNKSLTPELDSGALFTNNACDQIAGNAIYLSYFQNPTVQYNLALQRVNSGMSGAGYPLAASFVICTTSPCAGPSSGLTLTNSVFNQYGYAGQPGPLNVTNTQQVSVPASSYAAFPSLTQGQNPGWKTRAQFIAALAPLIGGGAMNADGSYNGPVFPTNDAGDQCWNNGAVFDHTKTCAQMGTVKAS
jgi:hypothetical protein